MGGHRRPEPEPRGDDERPPWIEVTVEYFTTRAGGEGVGWGIRDTRRPTSPRGYDVHR